VFPSDLCGKDFLAPVPIQIPPVAIHVAVFMPQFRALMPSRRIISIIQIAAQLAPVMSNPGFIMPDVPPIPPSIIGKHGSSAHSQHQQNSRNHPFHIRVLLRIPRGFYLMQTRRPPRSCAVNVTPRSPFMGNLSRVCDNEHALFVIYAITSGKRYDLVICPLIFHSRFRQKKSGVLRLLILQIFKIYLLSG
jgi:hypothetical protein